MQAENTGWSIKALEFTKYEGFHRLKGGDTMKEYWTAQDAATEWGITAQSVKALINRNRVKDAELRIINGRSTWVMPPQEKPTRTNKSRPAV